MQSVSNGENIQQEEYEQCSTYLFPTTRSMPPTKTTLDLSNVSANTVSASGSVIKGHARSASHGAVGTTATSSVVAPGIIGRPSALKQNRGHQRAFSQGQINDSGSVGFQKGHSRVGSKTDFILPPGHRDTETSSGAGVSTKIHGHSRQASRSESIYTLRQSGQPNLWTRFQSYVLRRGGKPEVESRYRTVVPNHLVPARTSSKLHPNGKSPDNRIRTTKYTFLSFLPKNLLEQFHRVANLYFIFIVLLNWFPAINAFGKEVSMIPVLFVLGVTAIKDLFEDRRRHASDKRINNSSCRVYKSEEERYKKVLWKHVKVGDLVHLSNNEVIPADILLLRSSEPNGICYIDTCNLDGETNLKQRQVARGFVEKQDIFEPSKFHSLVEVDAPTTKIYRFHGSMVHPAGERVPLSTENLLLRECVVKNTDFVEGIVVYAGHETKAMLNNGGPRYKRSKLERQMNMDIIWCVLILLVLCVIGAVGCKLWLTSYDNIPVPLFIPNMQDSTTEGLLSFWTFVIILQIMIPLSLYVTIEMAKLIQVYHIHNDINLYDPETNKTIECRALNITEELGQVQYVFSDKTGTLTENKMIFRRCAVGGVDYNHPPPENVQVQHEEMMIRSLTGKNTVMHGCILKGDEQHFCDIPLMKLRTRPGVPLPLLVNPRLQEELEAGARPSVHSQRLQEFLLLLAVCNTVVVSQHPHHDIMNASGVIEGGGEPLPGRVVTDPSTGGCLGKSDGAPAQYARLSESRSVTPSPPPPPGPPPPGGVRPEALGVPSLLVVRKVATPTPSPCELKPIFEAESPDELALVDAAYSYGCRLVRRTPQLATVAVSGQGVLDFEILKVLPFDSVRKCMSIVLLHPVNRKKILFCKGADSTILSNLAPTDDIVMQQHIFRTQQHLNSYARQGLRVLVMAKRTLSDAEFAEWQRSHAEAELALENRERRLVESYARLETNLTLLGATGIEDRLQEGVPETISALINAGIVMWVLTGDKPETAINVAYSARLFQPQMELLKLSARSRDQAESAILFYLAQVEQQNSLNDPTSTVSRGINQVGVFSRPVHVGNSSQPHSAAGVKYALVVDGKTLTYILDKRSNLQKPFLQLTQQCSSVLCCRATPLQKAYIVRIVKEQLKMRTLAIGDGANDVSMIQTADVGIGISGQEGRQAVMASDFALSRFRFLGRLLLVHGHWCYDRLARMVLYFFYKNAAFVFLVFWYQLYCGFSGAVMIDQMYLMLYNLLFTSLPPIAIGVYDQDVPEQVLLSQPSLYRQGRLGLVYQPHSFWVTMADALYQSIVIFFICEAAYHNTEVGIWEFGTTVTTSCMFVMLCHVAVETRSWTVIHVASIFLSIAAFYIFSLVYNTVCIQCFGLPSNYWVIQQTMGSAIYWASVFLSTVLALLPRFVWRILETSLFPREVVRAALDHKMATRRGHKDKGKITQLFLRRRKNKKIGKNWATESRPKDVAHNNLAVVG